MRRFWMFSGALVLGALSSHFVSAAERTPRLTTAHRVAVSGEVINGLPLAFEANAGQADARAKFVARSPAADLFMTEAGAVLAVRKSPGPPRPRADPDASRERPWVPDWFGEFEWRGVWAEPLSATRVSTGDALALRYRFVGAHPHPRIEGVDPLPGHSNYFIGNDPKRWHTGIARFARVSYHDVYPGVDVVYYGNGTGFEFDVEVAPGVDLAGVRVRVDGAESLALDGDGNLSIRTALGELIQRRPTVYQIVNGSRRELSGGYVLLDRDAGGSAHAVAFDVPGYDRSLALVLDPTLAGSFLIGGNGPDTGTAVASDASGNWYLTGYSSSPNFPTSVGAYKTSNQGSSDAFVYKVSNDGATVVYSTLLGGNGADTPTGIGVDAAGNAYVVGNTQSTNFPTLAALQGTNPGNSPGFVTALNAAGNGLNYSTYFGGNGQTAVNGVAVDAAGDAYIAGYTLATNLLTSVGAFQSSTAGQYSGFIFKFNPAGGEIFGTYLVDDESNFGFGSDRLSAIAIDDEGNSYVAGYTSSTIYDGYNGIVPERIGPGGGTYDMLVARLNNTGTWLDWVTLVGGSGIEEATAIAVDAGHQVFVTGWSASSDLPPSVSPTGNDQAWTGHLDETGTQLLDGIWLGASGANVFPQSLVEDPARGYAAVVGHVGNPASLQALNPLANDCANSCTGAGTNGGFIATYVFDANGSMQPDSVTRVVGIGGAGQTLFNGVAAAPESATSQLLVNGVTDGTPPAGSAIQPVPDGFRAPQTTGLRSYASMVKAIGNQATLPPVVVKRFDPPMARSGDVVKVTIELRNPNETQDIHRFALSDNLVPSCLTNLFGLNVYGVPAQNQVYIDRHADPSSFYVRTAYDGVGPAPLTIPGNATLTVTFSVMLISTNCDNTVTLTSDLGNVQATGRVIEKQWPKYTYTGDGFGNSAADPNNWAALVAPPAGSDQSYPVGPTKKAVNNDLPAAQQTHAIEFDGDSYELAGNPFNVLYGIHSAAANNTIAALIRFLSATGFLTSDPAPASLTLSGGVSLAGNDIVLTGAGVTNIASAISGVGSVAQLGPGKVNVSVEPTYQGPLQVCGGELDASVSIPQSVTACDSGTFRSCTSPNTCGDVTVSDNGDFYPCTGTTPCTAPVASLTCNGGRVELDCAANNTPCTNIVSTGPVVSTCDEVILHLQNMPTVGATFSNVITGSTNTGCPENVESSIPGVLMAPICTSGPGAARAPTAGGAVSLQVKAVDDLFHSGF